MKKLVSGLLAAACIATMSVGVMAADISDVKGTNYEWALNNGAYSVQVDGLTKGNRYGLLAIKADAALDDISEDNSGIVMYIDQAIATGESGTITFNGSGNGFLPKDSLDYDVAGYKLFLGGADLSGATQIGVLAAPESSITLDKTELKLKTEDVVTLTATTVPDGDISWDSSNELAATVTASGKTVEVTALNPGETIITATSSSGKTATCTVTVTEKPATIDITGKVIDTTVQGKSATVTVYDAEGNSLGSGTTSPTDGTYTVAVVPGSDYKIVVSKKAYCTYTITGVPAEDAISIKDIDISKLAGDLVANDSNSVDYDDLMALLRDYNKTQDFINANANINDDANGVDYDDLMILLRCYNNVAITEAYEASVQ